ncbi:DUF4124 domain-containing protein [Salicola sp. Rm-C-2C1-2]|uniref:DUF4124 domain-containing protein n=1 Tax=Salicola sp. Rm-C-2C1-2 TaxID=3141321 RepID=UPI0032E40A5C
MQRPALLAIGLVLAIPAPAEIYRCDQDGETVFSDSPCGSDAEKLEDVSAPKPGGDMGSGINEELQQQRSAERALESINRKIDDAREKRQSLKAEREAELDKVRARKRRANNNLAGATLENSLAQEERNIQERYQSRLDAINEKLDRLKDRRRTIRERQDKSKK